MQGHAVVAKGVGRRRSFDFDIGSASSHANGIQWINTLRLTRARLRVNWEHGRCTTRNRCRRAISMRVRWWTRDGETQRFLMLRRIRLRLRLVRPEIKSKLECDTALFSVLELRVNISGFSTGGTIKIGSAERERFR